MTEADALHVRLFLEQLDGAIASEAYRRDLRAAFGDVRPSRLALERKARDVLNLIFRLSEMTGRRVPESREAHTAMLAGAIERLERVFGGTR